jgi:adenylosuccinate synthase
MTRTAQAVIGAGYGDEGKGLLTDLLASRTEDAVVVRSNGGAQAGHTVVTPDGIRHVFHHVGSGAFAGAATHLSRHFVAHPMLLLEEWRTLRALGADLRLSSDPRALVTTPWDVMLNQAVELMRGDGRHGSTGVGFGETIERNLRPEFAIATQDLYRPGLAARLARIRDTLVPERLAKLGVPALPAELADALADPGLITRYLADCEAWLDRVDLLPDRRLGEDRPVIFEAAQGLLLDQDYGAFPHVTRSNTGLRNMLAIAAAAGLPGIDVIYATR